MLLEDAMEKIKAWKNGCKSFRPHSSLNGLTPDEPVGDYFKEPPLFKRSWNFAGKLWKNTFYPYRFPASPFK